MPHYPTDKRSGGGVQRKELALRRTRAVKVLSSQGVQEVDQIGFCRLAGTSPDGFSGNASAFRSRTTATVEIAAARLFPPVPWQFHKGPYGSIKVRARFHSFTRYRMRWLNLRGEFLSGLVVYAVSQRPCFEGDVLLISSTLKEKVLEL
jgi:hypothetical protein